MSVSWCKPVFLDRAAQKLIFLIIKREVGSIVGNIMLFYITLVAIEEDVINLLLVVRFYIFLISGKPCRRFCSSRLSQIVFSLVFSFSVAVVIFSSTSR